MDGSSGTDLAGSGADDYEADLRAWALRQARLLRARTFDAVDAENVAAEIESIGRAQASALQACYRSIAVHLLEIRLTPSCITRERAGAILRERMDAEGRLDCSPSLRSLRHNLFDAAYRQARGLAAAETGLTLDAFPADPPFTLEELSSEDHAPWPPPDA